MSSPTHPSILSTATLYFNKDNSKENFDVLHIRALSNQTFRVEVRHEATKETITTKTPYTFTATSEEIMAYLLDFCAMLREDSDPLESQIKSMDILIPGYPMIAVWLDSAKKTPFPEGLLRHVLNTWMGRELRKAACA